MYKMCRLGRLGGSMIKLEGKYGEATVHTDSIDNKAMSQIINILNYKHFENLNIKIMSDVHAGAGCVIGYTSELKGDIVPNLVGVDIGCGMLTIELGDIDIDLADLDRHIREKVPHGFSTHDSPALKIPDTDMKKLEYFAKKTGGQLSRFANSIGTLGGGNHFVEIGADSKGKKYLVIHSGSRNLGNVIAKYHQKQAIKHCADCVEELKKHRKDRIKELKKKGKTKSIKTDSLVIGYENTMDIYNVPNDLAFLQAEGAEEYYRDMEFAQNYAMINRETMAKIILEKLGFEMTKDNAFHTIHNYIDFKHSIIRKGAISAREGEKVLIPLNMRDGSILAVGKGNDDWNQSAPHGAGRLFSRGDAKTKLSLDDFKETMEGIYSTSVKQSTLDEAPDAYKPAQEILDNIGDTVEVLDIIKPIYNFKA